MPGAGRVLVVDDNEQVRTLIRRALTAHGYRVDTAVSLTQARLMEPGGYDALIIDAQIGAERGTELVGELRAADPGTVRRCIMITGGSLRELPADVVRLAKPFGPADLLAAVRGLGVPGEDGDPATPAGPRGPGAPGVHSLPQVHGPSAGPGDPGARPDRGAAGRAEPAGPGLLRLIARLRAAERAALADFVHEGPLQDLTAARLGLQLAAAGTPAGLAGRLAAADEQLGAVGLVLRRLVDGEWGPRAGRDLAGDVRSRAGWLVAGPVTVEVQPAGVGDGGGLLDLVELALFLLAGEQPTAAATVGIRLAGAQARIELTLSGVAGGSGTAPGDHAAGMEPAPAGAQAAATEQALMQLAAALGGTAATRFAGHVRQAWICLPDGWSGRASPPPAGG
jgi:CheY-like chemotaxis protein